MVLGARADKPHNAPHANSEGVPKSTPRFLDAIHANDEHIKRGRDSRYFSRFRNYAADVYCTITLIFVSDKSI